MNQPTTLSPTTGPAEPLSAPTNPSSTPAPAADHAHPAPRPAQRARYWEHIDPTSHSHYPLD